MEVRKYEMTPRGVVVTGARILTAATVAISSDLLEKQEIELLNRNMATTLPFPCLMDMQ